MLFGPKQNIYELAGYLSTVSDPKLRKVLSMYRLSEHSLRQAGLAAEERATVPSLHREPSGDRACLFDILPQIYKH